MMTEYTFLWNLINLRTKNKQTIISVDRRKSSSTFTVFLFSVEKFNFFQEISQREQSSMKRFSKFIFMAP